MVTETDFELGIYDLDAEEAVLGSILIDDKALDKVIGFLEPAHFFRDKNQWVFEAMLELDKRGELNNQITIAHELERRGRLEAIGGSAYMSNLIMNVPTSVHIEYYGRIVHRLAACRALRGASYEISDIAGKKPAIFSEALSEAEAKLTRLRADYITDAGNVLLHEEAAERYLAQQWERVDELSGQGRGYVSTPWYTYSRDVRHRNGLVSIVAAPSSHGKTILGEMHCEHAASVLGINALYLYNELSEYQLLTRRALRHIGQDWDEERQDWFVPRFYDLEDGKYAGTPIMDDYLARMEKWPGKITMVNVAGWSVYRIAAEIRDKAAKGLADFIVMDYVQLIPRENVSKRDVNDAKAMGLVLQVLKQTCQQIPHQPPILVLSQVNRKMQNLSDCSLDVLRDSGELGEYSNVVSILFNKWDATKGGCLEGCEENRGTLMPSKCNRRCVYLVTVKNTFGAKGEIRLIQVPNRFMFVTEDRVEEVEQMGKVIAQKKLREGGQR